MSFGDFLATQNSARDFGSEFNKNIFIGNWTTKELGRVKKELKQIAPLLLEELHRLGIKSLRSKSNQSLGNQIERSVYIAFSNSRINSVKIEKCRGPGYPDALLHLTKFGQKYLLEIKATSTWSKSDTNRRVLLSSTRKIQRLVAQNVVSKKPKHILLTLIYSKEQKRVIELRYDFLQPMDKMNIRLEASTSHALLAKRKKALVLIS